MIDQDGDMQITLDDLFMIFESADKDLTLMRLTATFLTDEVVKPANLNVGDRNPIEFNTNVGLCIQPLQ